ncbi:hypothetical protein Goshw_005533, partial [Gossypium schwendimanii]|nr:hypothetical protein [Gossypium schwendimanii]
KDSWIPGIGPFNTHIPTYYNLNVDCTLKDLVTSDAIWNLDMFRIWFPNEVINHIVSIPPPYLDSGSDKVF